MRTVRNPETAKRVEEEGRKSGSERKTVGKMRSAKVIDFLMEGGVLYLQLRCIHIGKPFIGSERIRMKWYLRSRERTAIEPRKRLRGRSCRGYKHTRGTNRSDCKEGEGLKGDNEEHACVAFPKKNHIPHSKYRAAIKCFCPRFENCIFSAIDLRGIATTTQVTYFLNNKSV